MLRSSVLTLSRVLHTQMSRQTYEEKANAGLRQAIDELVIKLDRLIGQDARKEVEKKSAEWITHWIQENVHEFYKPDFAPGSQRLKDLSLSILWIDLDTARKDAMNASTQPAPRPPPVQ